MKRKNKISCNPNAQHRRSINKFPIKAKSGTSQTISTTKKQISAYATAIR